MKYNKYFNTSTIIVGIGTLVAIGYLFSYLFPVTDNAFVINNVSPVAATVDGYLTEIYVKNGQQIKKGQPLVQIFQAPYQLALQQAQAKYRSALAHVKVLKSTRDKDLALLKSYQAKLGDLKYQYSLKSSPKVTQAVAKVEVVSLEYKIHDLTAEVDSLQAQVAIDNEKIHEQENNVSALMAEMNNAQVNLDETVIYALSNGYVQNMYLGLRAPVKAGVPLFSFVNSDETYIQANFNETDLRDVKPGDSAYIFPRSYLGSKIYRGEVVTATWGVNRVATDAKTQLQHVDNENQWLLLPQRMPLQIKVLNPDSHYPLYAGMSAYVYIHTH